MGNCSGIFGSCKEDKRDDDKEVQANNGGSERIIGGVAKVDSDKMQLALK